MAAPSESVTAGPGAAMAKRDKKAVAKTALANLAKALVGVGSGALTATGAPVLALVTKVFGDSLVDEVKARLPDESPAQQRLDHIKLERVATNLDTLLELILEVAEVVPEEKTPIEGLTEAVTIFKGDIDPKQVGEQKLLREAMTRLFDRAETVTDDIGELGQAVATHIVASGDQSLAAGRDIVFNACTIVFGDTLPAAAPEETPLRVEVTRLPATGPHLFGREDELARLDAAWGSDRENVISIVAPGGIGKSAVVNEWNGRMAAGGYRGAKRVFAWSFYSQGTRDRAAVSADDFINKALIWFGDQDPTKGSPHDKGARLAELVRKERTLLFLDGVEPLQYPPGPYAGRIKDPALAALVRNLGASNSGLCVMTTRETVTDVEMYRETTCALIDLESLSDVAGAELLRSLGVNGSQDELEAASKEFGGHGLALTLLGTYLVEVEEGDIRQRSELGPLTGETEHGEHAKHVMQAYENWLGDSPELCVLRILGLFDRPAEGAAIAALREGDPIEGLTDRVAKLNRRQWRQTLANLRRVRLLGDPDPSDPDGLDAHPLVREYFGDKLQGEIPDAWRKGHDQLYEYYKGPGCRKESPDTLEEMGPLYAAAAHGCAAGRHQEALHEVVWRRIQRREECYSSHKLGAIGANLGAVSCFFVEPWQRLNEGMSPPDQAGLLNYAGYYLRALGRLSDAVQPMAASLEAYLRQENWENTAIAVGNMSELHLMLGEIHGAVDSARQAVEFADRSRDKFQAMVARSQVAATLHQAGRKEEANDQFREAEKLAVEIQAPVPFLCSLAGYQYCDLLLDDRRTEDVLRRAIRALEVAKQDDFLLDIALNRLSLGRARLLATAESGGDDFAEAHTYLDQAVAGLRDSGVIYYLPDGLIARAELCRHTNEWDKAKTELDEAWAIATRDPQGQMRLHMTDCHLEYARLAIDKAQSEGANGHIEQACVEEARGHVESARVLIEKTGYHRRDDELAELQQRLRACS